MKPNEICCELPSLPLRQYDNQLCFLGPQKRTYSWHTYQSESLPAEHSVRCCLRPPCEDMISSHTEYFCSYLCACCRLPVHQCHCRRCVVSQGEDDSHLLVYFSGQNIAAARESATATLRIEILRIKNAQRLNRGELLLSNISSGVNFRNRCL